LRFCKSLRIHGLLQRLVVSDQFVGCISSLWNEKYHME
jgi:hypothetical protein